MKFRVLAIVLLLIALGLIGCVTSSNSSSSSTTGFLYIATQGDSGLAEFSLDLTTGIATADGKSIPTGSVPSAMVVSPSGDAIFVANKGSNDISRYTINSDGSATVVSGTQAAGNTPVAMVMDPGGKYLFVANQGTLTDRTSSTISVFGVQGTTLTEVPGSPFPTALPADTAGTGPSGLAVTPDGNYLYVANQFINTVTAYSVNSSTGALTSLAIPSYTVGTNPSGVSVTGEGNFLYVANTGSNNVSAFVICDNLTPTCTTADGSLATVTGSPFAAGVGPVAITSTFANPWSRFLYVLDQQSNQISQYKIAKTTGVLTNNTTPAISTGLTPSAFVIRAGDGTVLSTTGGTTDYMYVVDTGGSTLKAYGFDTTLGNLAVVSTPVLTGGQPSALGAH